MGRKKKSKYSDIDDSRLAKMSAEGDNGAFSELILRYHKSLKQFVYLYCMNSSDTEDICQETYRKAFQSISQYNPEYKFKTWLFYIARNNTIDHMRRKNLYTTVNIGESTDNGNADPKEDTSPEDKMIDNQLYNSFLKIIDGLPEKYREIARMRFVGEFCYDEIAKEVNLPLNTVRTRIRRARMMISEVLKNNV